MLINCFSETMLNTSLWHNMLSICEGASYHDYVDGNKAAKLGHLSLLVMKKGSVTVHSSVQNLIDGIKNGKTEPMNVLPLNFLTITKKGWDWAALNGHLHVLEWLHLFLPDVCSGTAAFDNACKSGHLQVIEWLMHNRCPSSTSKGMDWAAENGHISILKKVFLEKESLAEWTTDALDYSASNGHLQVLEWLQSKKKMQCSTLAMDLAASNGHLKTLEWLNENGASCTNYAMAAAAQHGHLAVLEYLHAHTTSGCSGEALNWAAAEGHLPVIEWLHRNRIGVRRTNTDAMDFAAGNGHFHVVEWLHINRTEGCSEVALLDARNNGHPHILEWLQIHFHFGEEVSRRSREGHRMKARGTRRQRKKVSGR